jgi:hypothetical protein
MPPLTAACALQQKSTNRNTHVQAGPVVREYLHHQKQTESVPRVHAMTNWHVSGPHFRDYHLLLDEQAAQIFGTTDTIAERVNETAGITDPMGDVGRPASPKGFKT